MPKVRRSDQLPVARGSAFVESRTEARRLLDRSPSARIVVVTAPAGSGKSRLVQEWLADPGPDGRTADWVRIDLGPEDQDSPAPGQCALDNTLYEAARWLSATAREWPRFVLTGLEMLTAAETVHLVDYLLAGLPPQARLMLVGAGSGLPASCVVGLGSDLLELRFVDLWWSRADLVDQLARLTGITATGPEAEQLFRLTGGWPAGVIILGRAMRSGPSVLAARDLTAVPEILDFVVAEVLDRLPPSLRRWVWQTAVLDELEVDACAALVPGEAPQARLAHVHRQGLTLALWPGTPAEPSPADRPVARYHPLIRAAALRELHSSDVGSARKLLLLAGEQAHRCGREPAAVGYLAAAADWDGVLVALLRSAGNGFRGWDSVRLRAVVDQLPGHAWEHDAERRALLAFAAGMSGDQLLAAAVIQQTSAELRDGAAWWPVLTRLIEALPGPAGGAHGGYRAACSALVELQTLDPTIAIPAILGVADRPSLSGMAHLLAARAGVFDRDQAGVRRHLEAGWSEVGAQIPRYCVLAGLGADALTAVWGGELAAAARRAARAQRLADEAGLAEHPMLNLTVLARAELLRARGQSSQALVELDANLTAVRRSEPFVAAAAGGRVHTAAAQILRAGLHLDLDQPALARLELELLATEGDDDLPRNLWAARAVTWARLHLLSDNAGDADRVLAAAPITGTVAAARVAVAVHRQAPEEAQILLQSWPFEDTLDNQLRLLLATSAVAIAMDRRLQAAEQIGQCLVAAEPDGHVQVFLEAPPRARAMAAAVLKRSLDASGWRADLADRLDQVRETAAATSELRVTRRELSVLEYLTTSMTHSQIAGQLFVSDNTLKSHCRNLYRKLGVNTRADAISVARARGVLDLDLSPQGDVAHHRNITLDPAAVEL
jgi:LuxR family maltose regulon positive regulatory protein